MQCRQIIVVFKLTIRTFLRTAEANEVSEQKLYTAIYLSE